MGKIAREEKNQRVVTFLRREEVDFLDKLGKDALFSTGMKLSRAKLIAWLVDFVEKLKINGEDIKSENDFQKRITQVMCQGFRGSVPSFDAAQDPSSKNPERVEGPATGDNKAGGAI